MTSRVRRGSPVGIVATASAFLFVLAIVVGAL